MTATYGGDANFSASSNSATASIARLTPSPSFASLANPSTVGQAVTFTITLSGSSAPPSGTVTIMFGDGGSSQVTIPLAGGVASVDHVYAAPGSYSWTADYSGDQNYIPVRMVLTQAVSSAVTTTSLNTSQNPSGVGQPVTFTAIVTSASGTPSGTVTFNFGDGAPTTPITLAGGVATTTHTYTTAANFTVTAAYGGDANFAGGTTLAAQIVQPASSTTTLTAAPNPSTVGQAVTFTATVTSAQGSPNGTVTFAFGDGTTATGTLAGGVVTASHSYAAAGSFSVSASYGGDAAFGTSTAAVTETIDKLATTTALASSLNPSGLGQNVTFLATVSGASPTGTVTFKDGATVLGSTALSGGTASLATSALTKGSHVITASYAGDGKYAASISPGLTQSVGTPADSVNLRSMQDRVAPMVAQMSGQSIAGVVDSAIGEAFNDDGSLVTPTGSGIRFNFAGEAEGKDRASAMGSPRITDPFASAFAAGGNASVPRSPTGRLDRAFDALGDSVPAKAPRAREARDWYGWAEIRGATLSRWGTQNAPPGSGTIYGNQVNLLAGLTRKLTPDVVVGALGGYETFDYRSDALQGRLKGDGWTVSSYLGWHFAPRLRLDAALAYSGIGYDGTAGAAAGTFGGQRWLVSGGVTGSYAAYGFQIEPSARIYALWEHENAYTDTLGTSQGDRNFAAGRASGGARLSYPTALESAVRIAPYAGLFGDYYFNRDSSPAGSTAAVVPIPLVLDGWSARAIGGIAASFANDARFEIGGERSGIGGNFAIWTTRARASIPFGAR